MSNYEQNDCSECNGISRNDIVLQDMCDCCTICYKFFCTACDRGCDCIWRNTPKGAALKAHEILRRVVFRYILSEEKCEASHCNSRVPFALIKSCDMIHTVFGGRGFKCRTHVCPCDLEDGFVNYMTEQCYRCNQLSCMHYTYGCECDNC